MVNKLPHKKKKKLNLWIPITLIVLATLSFVAGLMINQLSSEEEQPLEVVTPESLDLDTARYASLVVPAVDNEGMGVGSTLTVGIMSGTGRTLVDIDSLLFWVDTQSSIRTAKKVAEEYTGKNLEEYNLVYKVEANASIIGGPSAGAAIAIATIAAIQGDVLRDNVMITGSLNHDGTIGPVGGILEKAQAAKQIGGELLLVPLSQGTEITYEQREHCELFGGVEFCSEEIIPKRISVSSEVGIPIEEVENIGDAYAYFVSQSSSSE